MDQQFSTGQYYAGFRSIRSPQLVNGVLQDCVCSNRHSFLNAMLAVMGFGMSAIAEVRTQNLSGRVMDRTEA